MYNQPSSPRLFEFEVPLYEEHVLPGTRTWKPTVLFQNIKYTQVASLWDNRIINNSNDFADPITGAKTNDEFMWRGRFK